MKNTYHQDQLKKIKTDSIYAVIVKFADPYGNTTNSMDLNLESIPEIIKFLKSIEKNLKKGVVNE